MIRILIIDDKGILRDGLCALLATVEEFEVIGAEATAEDGLRAVANAQPDVVIADCARLKANEQDWIARMKAQCPGVRVLLLNSVDIGNCLDQAPCIGADGILLKNDGCNELFTGLRTVAAGRRFVSPSATKPIDRSESASGNAAADTGIALSDREKQVIRLIAQGRRTREIAQLLSLSHKTIEKHRMSLMRKLGLRNASAVAAYAIAHGLA